MNPIISNLVAGLQPAHRNDEFFLRLFSFWCSYTDFILRLMRKTTILVFSVPQYDFIMRTFMICQNYRLVERKM